MSSSKRIVALLLLVVALCGPHRLPHAEAATFSDVQDSITGSIKGLFTGSSGSQDEVIDDESENETGTIPPSSTKHTPSSAPASAAGRPPSTGANGKKNTAPPALVPVLEFCGDKPAPASLVKLQPFTIYVCATGVKSDALPTLQLLMDTKGAIPTRGRLLPASSAPGASQPALLQGVKDTSFDSKATSGAQQVRYVFNDISVSDAGVFVMRASIPSPDGKMLTATTSSILVAQNSGATLPSELQRKKYENYFSNSMSREAMEAIAPLTVRVSSLEQESGGNRIANEVRNLQTEKVALQQALDNLIRVATEATQLPENSGKMIVPELVSAMAKVADHTTAIKAPTGSLRPPSELQKARPTIFIYGAEKAGKSTFISVVARTLLGFSRMEVATVCPVRYQLRYSDTRECKFKGRVIPCEEMFENIGAHMDSIIQAAPKGKTRAIAEELVVEISNPDYALDLDIVDSPGTVTQSDDQQDMHADTMSIIETYSKRSDTLMVLVATPDLGMRATMAVAVAERFTPHFVVFNRVTSFLQGNSQQSPAAQAGSLRKLLSYLKVPTGSPQRPSSTSVFFIDMPPCEPFVEGTSKFKTYSEYINKTLPLVDQKLVDAFSSLPGQDIEQMGKVGFSELETTLRKRVADMQLNRFDTLKSALERVQKTTVATMKSTSELMSTELSVEDIRDFISKFTERQSRIAKPVETGFAPTKLAAVFDLDYRTEVRAAENWIRYRGLQVYPPEENLTDEERERRFDRFISGPLAQLIRKAMLDASSLLRAWMESRSELCTIAETVKPDRELVEKATGVNVFTLSWDFNAFHKVVRALAADERIGAKILRENLVERLVFVLRNIARYALTDILEENVKFRALMENKGFRDRFDDVIMKKLNEKAARDKQFLDDLWINCFHAPIDLEELEDSAQALLSHFDWINEDRLRLDTIKAEKYSSEPARRRPGVPKPEQPQDNRPAHEIAEEHIERMRDTSHLLFLSRLLLWLKQVKHHITATWIEDLVEPSSATRWLERELLPANLTADMQLKEFGIGNNRRLVAELVQAQGEWLSLLQKGQTEFHTALLALHDRLKHEKPW